MAVKDFNNYLMSAGLDFQVDLSEQPTRTAQEAAQVHNVPVSNIVKSLLIRGMTEDGLERYVLILTPGDKRLDVESWGSKLGLKGCTMANADQVKSVTGYSIGGVPPFGHLSQIETYIEDGFDRNSTLVAAAGAFNATFKLSFDQLKEIVKA